MAEQTPDSIITTQRNGQTSYFHTRKRLLFSFAYDQKGATNYDKTGRENPRGIDRRD